ncbi:hypothetical protein ACN26Y_00855 [Micromonospora sp. WMMD558]|uniref:hypothetical protein n=1 Tax=unclassified Micromonospora TaxID=2617518 RepID=UPI0012B49CCD|nr:hypothetical protein [Micromonospora sp. WMMC415]QGN50229.1 hypothetical protein GKC29_27695 [Micromonospora sp. WMMC415]
MGLDVVLYRALPAGRRVSYVPVRVVPDNDDTLLGLLDRIRGAGRTPLLDGLDPVGDRAFDARSVPTLLEELRCLADVAGSEAEAARVRSVVALARRCLREPGTEIRFEGD